MIPWATMISAAALTMGALFDSLLTTRLERVILAFDFLVEPKSSESTGQRPLLNTLWQTNSVGQELYGSNHAGH